MPFYRLTTPSYYGGLPTTHDATGINNLSGPGTPAPVSTPPGAGTYQNTRFEVPLELAEATKVNRANSALAENCDFIDDILHTSHPVPASTNRTAGGGGDAFTDLSDDTFVGRAGVTVTQLERNRLIQVVQQTTFEPVVDTSGVPIYVSDLQVSGGGANVIGTEASGFHTAPRAVFSSTIPAATNYRLVFLTRSTVAIEQEPSDATGGMGYLAQAVIEASRLQSGTEMPFAPGLSSWADASNLVATTIQTAIDEVVDTLGDNSLGVAGALHVGAEVYTGVGTSLTQGSVESQLQELADELAGLAASNTFAGALNTFSGDVTFNASAVSFLATGGGGNILLDGNATPYPIDATADGLSIDHTNKPFNLTGGSGSLTLVGAGGSPYLVDVTAGGIQIDSSGTSFKVLGPSVSFSADDATNSDLFRLQQSGTGVSAAGALRFQGQPGRDVASGPNNNGGVLQVLLAAPGAGGTVGTGRWGGHELKGVAVYDHDGVVIGDCIRRTIVLANEVDDAETITGWYTSPFGALAQGETEVAEITIVGSIRPSAVLSNSGVKAYTCIWARVNPGTTVNAAAVAHGVSDAGNTTYLPQTFTATDATQVPTIDITRTAASGNIEVVAWIRIYRIPAR